MLIVANFTLALFMLNDKKLGEHIKREKKKKICNNKKIIKVIMIIIKLRLPNVFNW